MTVTWNSADKSANITLSGGSLVATTTSATQGAVRATASSAGKIYFEAKITNTTGSLWSIGVANATASLAAALGSTVNSVVYQPNTVGRVFFNNSALGGSNLLGATPPGVGTVLCIAFDPAAKLIWFRWNGGKWNGSDTANPATGTGGLSVAAIGAGPYFPIFGDNGSGGAVTANFGASETMYPVPSGFSTLDTNVINYAATPKFSGLAITGPPSNAVSAAKFSGLAITGPPSNAVSAAKFVGYAITTSQLPPFTRQRELTYLRM